MVTVTVTMIVIMIVVPVVVEVGNSKSDGDGLWAECPRSAAGSSAAICAPVIRRATASFLASNPRYGSRPGTFVLPAHESGHGNKTWIHNGLA